MNPNETLLFAKRSLPTILVLGLLALMMFFLNSRNESNHSTEVVPPAASTANSVDTSGKKLYRNEEYGFEFLYPVDWEWEKNIFGGQSIFNLTLMKINDKYINQDNYFSVVSIEWAKGVAQQHEANAGTKISSRVVAGVPAKEYRYTSKTVPIVSVHIPRGDQALFVVFDANHETEFDAILSSLTFIR